MDALLASVAAIPDRAALLDFLAEFPSFEIFKSNYALGLFLETLLAAHPDCSDAVWAELTRRYDADPSTGCLRVLVAACVPVDDTIGLLSAAVGARFIPDALLELSNPRLPSGLEAAPRRLARLACADDCVPLATNLLEEATRLAHGRAHALLAEFLAGTRQATTPPSYLVPGLTYQSHHAVLLCALVVAAVPTSADAYGADLMNSIHPSAADHAAGEDVVKTILGVDCAPDARARAALRLLAPLPASVQAAISERHAASVFRPMLLAAAGGIETILTPLLGPPHPTEGEIDGDLQSQSTCGIYGCRMMTCICYDDHPDEDTVPFILDTPTTNMDWFHGQCLRCGHRIECASHAYRYPMPVTGWAGCYCGRDCAEACAIELEPESVEYRAPRADAADVSRGGDAQWDDVMRQRCLTATARDALEDRLDRVDALLSLLGLADRP